MISKSKIQNFLLRQGFPLRQGYGGQARPKILSILLTISSALLLILSFPNVFNKNGFSILAWVGLFPLFFVLENKAIKARFLTAYFAGVVFYTGLLYWLFRVSVPGTIVLILLLSLFFGLFGLFLNNAIRNTRYAILYIPSLWVSIEFLRTYLFTGFPWALLGYSQHLNLPVIQIADITGAYGVSFLIVYVNCVFYEVFANPAPMRSGRIKRSKNTIRLLAGAALVFAALLFYGKYCLEKPILDEGLKVSAIQASIPQHMKWRRSMEDYILDKHEALSREAAKERSELIIWPETSFPGELESDHELRERLLSLAKSIGKTLLIGTAQDGKRGYYNAATLISGKGEIVKSYRKLHLVPFGEYAPFEKIFPFIRRLIDKPIGDFIPGDEYTLFRFSVIKKMTQGGKEPGVVEKATSFYNFGALICFEDIFPNLVRKFVKKGANFMAVITNDAWFGVTPAPIQHNQASVFRAVENRVPFVRAANTGVTCIIDQKGHVLDSVNVQGKELFVEGIVTAAIKPFYWKSIYTMFGDLFAWICVFFFLLGLSFRKRNLKHD